MESILKEPKPHDCWRYNNSSPITTSWKTLPSANVPLCRRSSSPRTARHHWQGDEGQHSSGLSTCHPTQWNGTEFPDARALRVTLYEGDEGHFAWAVWGRAWERASEKQRAVHPTASHVLISRNAGLRGAIFTRFQRRSRRTGLQINLRLSRFPSSHLFISSYFLLHLTDLMPFSLLFYRN
jgi:hypothetical protein